MSGPTKAEERPYKTVSEVRNFAVSFHKKLDSGELLTGTPVALEVTTSDLTLSNKSRNSSEMKIYDRNGGELTVAANKVVTFTVAGGSVNKAYKVKISCATDATNAQTLYGDIEFGVVADSDT
jgi:hypothetical protein